MYKLFKARRDTWSVKRGDEYFRVTGKEMTLEVYEQHLTGAATIGVYPLLPSGEFCFFAAMDIDCNNLELVNRTRSQMPQPNYIERSRSGNYHVWMFFNEPVPVDALTAACSSALSFVKRECSKHCNLYPLRAKGLGLLIALPLQYKCVKEDLTVFVDDTGKVIEDQYDFLRAIKYTRAPGSPLDDAELKALWLGEGKTTGDTSQSGYDFSFCVALFKRGYSQEATKKLLRKRPGLHQDTEEYLIKTLDAARASKPAATATKQPTRVVDWSAIKPIPRDECYKRLNKRLVLYKEQMQQFDIFFAVIAANLKTKGRPVWLLFVGPPGCGKTLPMMAIQYAPHAYATSAFRPTALISGWGHKGGEDLSLIPKLDGKILLVKDLSSLLSQHKEIVAEVLGLLRDAYDGACSRTFGTGVERSYTSRFGFIGATTPDIDAHWSLNVRLGERFLRYRCRSTPSQVYEKIDLALEKLVAEDKIDLEIENSCLAFLKYLADSKEPFPRLSNMKEIGRLAQLGAILRTAISRSPFGHEVLVIPEWEEATRYAKQLAKVALGLAYVRGKPTNNGEEMEDLKALVRDAMDARIERICKVIYNKQGLESGEIAERVGLPAWTVRSCLDNLAVARIVYHQRNSFTLTWSFVPWLLGQVNKFKLWERSKK